MNTPIAKQAETDTYLSPLTGDTHTSRDRFACLHCWVAGLAAYIFNRVIMHIPCRLLRTLVFRMRVAAVGKDVRLLMGVEVRNGRNVSLGNRVVINRGVLLDGRGGRLVIGDDVDIAQETIIWTLQHDVHSDAHADQGGDVFIDDHVWLASRVTILPGIHIGRGAVVACNSVVTKDVPPMAIVAGAPARVIGQRNNKLQYKLSFRPWFE